LRRSWATRPITRCWRRTPRAGAGAAPVEAVEPGRLTRSELFGDLLHPSGFDYGMAIGVRTERREAVVAGLGRAEREFSERDRDLLDLVRPALEGACGPPRRASASSRRLPRSAAGHRRRACSIASPRSSSPASTPSVGWPSTSASRAPGLAARTGRAVAGAARRAALVSDRERRRLTIHLLPGDPHALLLEEEVTSFRAGALDRLGLTARESEVLRAASAIDSEADIAWELFLSLHAVRERLARLEAKLGVRTAADAVARALRESI
jgi:DNA-binding CsgD family transcriptional regulator